MQHPNSSVAAATATGQYKPDPHKAALSPVLSAPHSKRRVGPQTRETAAAKSNVSTPVLPHKDSMASSAFGGSTSSTLSLRTPEQVHADLLYLQQHRVCETLEFIVKTLLRDQPEDPILNICNMLRESNRSDSSVRVSVSNQTRVEGISPGKRGASGQRVLDLSKERPKGAMREDFPEEDKDSVQHEDDEGAVDVGAPTCLFPEAASPSVLGSPVTDGSGRGWGVFSTKESPLAPTAADTTHAAVGGHFTRNLNGSTNSRITTPSSSTAGGARWLADTLQQTVHGNFPQTRAAPRLERDESSRSDGSLFSVASVDITEFMAEFRAAHQGLYGEGGRSFISIQDLADIVDRITIPLPDVRLLVDLFNELGDTRDPDASEQALASETADAVGGDSPGAGLVGWDTFLARMGFRIQGRYSQEALRSAFISLLPADAMPTTPPSSPAEAEVRRVSLNSRSLVGGRTLAAQGSVGSNLDSYFATNQAAAVDTASVLSNSYAAGGAVQSLSLAALRAPTVSVTAESISRVALWEGLGIQHRPNDLIAALRSIQIKPTMPPSPAGSLTCSPTRVRDGADMQLVYQLHFADFVRLVQRLQSQQ